jgi:orotate phosphoribosyltransferase
MKDYQRDFIKFAIAHKVIQFGDFVLKSGRASPYFFNAGLFNDGKSLAKLGRFYAETLEDSGCDYDVLFGPAYKGIPLVSATAVALYNIFSKDAPFTYNRKEAKDHGEGGVLVGSPLQGRVMVIDDVITAGTAIRECIDIIKNAGAELKGVIVAVDRQEKGNSNLSAIQELEKSYGIIVKSIVKLDDVIEFLREEHFDGALIQRIQDYRKQYGIADTNA